MLKRWKTDGERWRIVMCTYHNLTISICDNTILVELSLGFDVVVEGCFTARILQLRLFMFASAAAADLKKKNTGFGFL